MDPRSRRAVSSPNVNHFGKVGEEGMSAAAFELKSTAQEDRSRTAFPNAKPDTIFEGVLRDDFV